MTYSALAQSVERLPVKEDVLGSSPRRGASAKQPRPVRDLFCQNILRQGSNGRGVGRTLWSPAEEGWENRGFPRGSALDAEPNLTYTLICAKIYKDNS